MKSWVLAASLLAAAATTTTVWAADLDEGPPPDRYGAYEDPRYADMYAHPQPPPAYVPPPSRYASPVPQGYAPPVPPGYVHRDYGDDYDGDDYRDRYAYGRPPAYGPSCAPHEVIKERLVREGWHNFRDVEDRGEFATILARRPDGRPFALTLDRCSGEIVNARPLGENGHFAYGPPPRYWDRPY
jgi:hypothetical protein